ncbi:MAG: PilZ domain-containing protein, partial [Mesorhizobium sp.]
MTNSAQPLEENSGEHRREHRQRVLKGGTIITGIQNSEVSCT